MNNINLFCDFKTRGFGSCGKYTGGGRCLKHFHMIEKQKIERQYKFRGDSKWQKEQGMFKNK